MLDEFLANAATRGVVIIPKLLRAIEAKLDKSMALSGIYRMLARHGWRKIDSDTRHPQGDPAECEACEPWKQNP